MTSFSVLRASVKRSVLRVIAAGCMGTLLFSTSAFGVIIYDNGTLLSGATSKSGVAAPTGAQWSEAQNDFGVTNYANTLAGVGCQQIGTTTNNRCADDFNVPVGQTWTINSVAVFGYQTNFAGTVSPFISANMRIWNGRPGDAGSTVVFGDTTTNRMGTSTDAGGFRIFNSVVGAGANPPSAPGTTRRIWQVNITVSPGLALTAGNYWVDFQLNAGANGSFSPASTIIGTRNVPFSNARQAVGGTVWADILDAGQTPTGNPAPIQMRQEFPFKLDGSIAGAPAVPRSRTIDFDGDNKTDLAVVRGINAGSQTTWWIRNSNGGSITGVNWGTGAGFAGGDRVTPADFDGDGKTDIAVWRGGASPSFYVLNSSNNSATVVPFGLDADDPSVVGDYDGDGKADPAVYRAGVSAGAQSVFYFKGSLNNPSGNITYTPWGISGDRPIPGDFDGDGRFDFQVARDSGGSAQHYRLIIGTGAFLGFQFGLFSDRFVAGDFDGDAKADIAAIRNSAGAWDWYVFASATASVFNEKFGAAPNDYLTPGDYDGDSKWDLSVWRSGAAAADTKFFNRNTFASPESILWGSSAGAQTPPDYPVANFRVH